MDSLMAELDELSDDRDVHLKNAFAAHYMDLKRIAHARLFSARLNGELATTALVHEAYLKLAAGAIPAFADRVRFLAYASRVIRSVVMDLVREQRASKRGGDIDLITLNTDVASGLHAINGLDESGIDVETIHDALTKLEELDPGLARLVEMRFFAGLTEVEIAAATGSSERTVRREWQTARAILLSLIRD
jgi:RNA polymerase sigma factor (TIGR02999 family)